MTRGRRVVIGAAVVAGGVVALIVQLRPNVVEIAPGVPVADAARAAPGSELRLLPGVHHGFDLRDRVTVVGEPGAIVAGPVGIYADGVGLDGVTVEGGETGILVRGADDVELSGVTVIGAEVHGVEIVEGSARISSCVVSGLRSTFAQGIEVRNANGRPRTIVEGCSVHGGQEGIVSHVSRVEILDNVVTATTQRGITVTEMSEGFVAGNTVHDVVGNAVYCGDMSHCEIRDNRFDGVAADPGASLSEGGWAIAGLYHSTLRATGNEHGDLEGGAMRLSIGTVEVPTFPLGVWPQGWGGLWPGGAVATAAAAVAVGLIVGAVRPPIARRRVRTAAGAARLYGDGAIGFVAAAVGVQAFHMLEHLVQVWQVYVIDAEIRAGLLGQAVDTEWVHFAYNLAVVAFAVWLAIVVSRGRFGVAASSGWSLAFLATAAVIQTYHFAEHVAKIVQHEALALDPAPGIVGDDVGLVWFHFSINLAVFAALIVGAWPLFRRDAVAAHAVATERVAGVGA